MLDNPLNITISNTRIKKLSPLLINQLSAGEVVTRPAAVVKELLENAIDAKATHIEVRITQGGMGMIEVVDNGVGIHPDDMVMAITRHATSKVADIANLQGISTLGFRGEALAATAAVSRLTLISSHDDSGVGRQLQVTGVLAQAPKLLPVVHNRGTTITVKDLYFNVPARRGNLKSIATEFAHIETIVREVALAYADVTLNLFHDHKKRLSLSASTSNSTSISPSPVSSLSSIGSTHSRLPLARLEQALGIALTDDALQVNVDLTALVQQTSASTQQQSASINGWLWPISESDALNNSLPKLLYINGRLVKEQLISNQLRQLAQSAQFNHIGYALYFELPLHWLNLNVHPTKQRIKITSLNNIMAHLSHAISLKLKGIRSSSSGSLAIKKLDTKQSATQSQSLTGHLTISADRDPVKYPAKGNGSIGPLWFQQSSAQLVQEPTAYYQHSQAPLSSAATVTTDLSTTNSPITTAATTSKLVDLPQCLDVIDNVEQQRILNEKNSLSKQPWLLFYTKGKLTLVSQQQWQASLALLFNSHSSASYPVLADAASVNQQLAYYIEQMSQADALAFKVDIEQIVTLQALKSIERSQLIALMLSSPSC